MKKIAFVLVAFFMQITAFAQLETPVLESVSVSLQTKLPVLNWSMTDVSQVDGYVVYRKVYGVAGVLDGSYMEITRINSAGTLVFEDNTTIYGLAQPEMRPESYNVSSFKLNGTDATYSVASFEKKSILFKNIVFDQCTASNTLNWTKFAGSTAEAPAYRIMMRTDPTAPFVQLTEVSDTNYVHTNLTGGATYYYRIYAYLPSSATFFSASNEQSAVSTAQDAPSYINGNYASVDSNNDVEVSFTVSGGNLTNYALVRTVDSAVDTLQTFTSGGTLIYTDVGMGGTFVASYQLVAYNNCGLSVLESNKVSTILPELVQRKTQLGVVDITWNEHQEWRGEVAGYNLYRINQTNTELIATLDSRTLEYTDDVSGFLNQGNPVRNFCYYLEASEENNPFSLNATTQSYIKCVEFTGNIFVPNAFNPKSNTAENTVFRPTVSSSASYHLMVFNRWGEKIFESTDPLIGWDGNFNGQLAERGMYAYYLQYSTTSGLLMQQRDFVMLIY